MFDFIVLRRTSLGERPIDIGAVAEALLFYQRLHIVLDIVTLPYFLRTLSADTILSLLTRSGVTASFQRIWPSAHHGVEYYSFGTVYFSDAKGKKIIDGKEYIGLMTYNEYIASIIEHTLGRSRNTTKFVEQFLQHVEVTSDRAEASAAKVYLTAASEDVKDRVFLHNAIKGTLSILTPGYVLPANWRFQARMTGTIKLDQPEFAIDTNLNFEDLNRKYHKHTLPSRYPKPAILEMQSGERVAFALTHDSIEPLRLLSFILSGREAIDLSTKYMAEVMTDPVSSSVMSTRFVELLRKRDASIKELDLFRSIVLPNYKTIRQVINSGERSFDEFLVLLDASLKFKKFIETQNPDKKLVEAYMEGITKDGWAEKLPSRTSRFVIANGLGLAVDSLIGGGLTSLAITLGYSAVDTFMLDKVLKGWRPNRFIDDEVIPFLSGDSNR